MVNILNIVINYPKLRLIIKKFFLKQPAMLCLNTLRIVMLIYLAIKDSFG